MNWDEICNLCQAELEPLLTKHPSCEMLFGSDNIAQSFYDAEQEFCEDINSAVREFAASGRWPDLTPIQEVMLSFRLDFAASTAYLLNQQPAPWTDAEVPDQREKRLAWLLLFAWQNEGFIKLHKTLQRFKV